MSPELRSSVSNGLSQRLHLTSTIQLIGHMGDIFGIALQNCSAAKAQVRLSTRLLYCGRAARVAEVIDLQLSAPHGPKANTRRVVPQTMSSHAPPVRVVNAGIKVALTRVLARSLETARTARSG
jgi:hypothetical protein